MTRIEFDVEGQLIAELVSARAQVDRLRSALTEIINLTEPRHGDYQTAHVTAALVVAVAEAALDATTEV